jgi:O-Antigen ligase
MNSIVRTDVRRYLLAASALGLWAALVAVAPDITTKALLLAPAGAVLLAGWTLARPGRWVAMFLTSALLLPPLPLALGDSGPHPSMIFAALGIWAGLLWMRGWRVPRTEVAGALLALFAALLVSVGMAAVNSGGAIAAGSFARVALFGIGVYVFFFAAGAVEGGLPGLRWLYWCAVAAALFACVDFYFQFPAPAGYGPQFVWLDSGVFRRAQGLFYEASTLGNFCVFFLVMIAVALARPRGESPVGRTGLAAGGAVLFAAMVLSYSRASAINLAIALLVLLWWNRGRVRLGRLVMLVAVLTACAALLVWKVFPQFAEMYWLRLSYSAEYLTSATESVLSGRVASWRTLVDWVAAHPLQALVGIGYKTLPYTEYLGAPIVADNMYLSLLVETGVAGLAALIWLNVAIVKAAARAARSADARRAFCGLWMLCFWFGESAQMASGDLLTYWRVLPVYFFVLAVALRV